MSKKRRYTIAATHQVGLRRIHVRRATGIDGTASFDLADADTGVVFTPDAPLQEPPSLKEIAAVVRAFERGHPDRSCPVSPPVEARLSCHAGPEREAILSDSELLDLLIAAKIDDGHDDDFPFTVEDAHDLDTFQAAACNAIPAGRTHPIRHILIWPNADESDALVTLDLANGLRVASLCVEARDFINDDPSNTGTAANIEFALAELLYQGHLLADRYEQAVQAVRPSRWWRRLLTPAMVARRVVRRVP
jgi:hypothetical protein